MKKTELFHMWHVEHHFDSHIWGRWVDLKLEAAGIKSSRDDPDRWQEIVYSMPKFYEVNFNIRNNTVTFTWDGGSETYPLIEFYDDEDEQPNLEMLWHSNYWDGPLSGVATLDGEVVWFDLKEEDDYGNRLFELFTMPEDVQREIFKRHEEFREAVGHHSDHHPDMHSPYRGQDQEKFDQYYKNAKKRPALDPKGKKVGEAYWHQFKYWSRP